MSRRSLVILALATGALVALVLLGPGGSDESEALIWKKSFRRIVYTPGLKADDEPAKSEIDEKSGKKAIADNSAPDKNIPIEFHKRGMFAEEFFVQNTAGARAGGPVLTRRGNHTVKSIFREWNKPANKGVYSAMDRRDLKEFLPDRKYGLLELFESGEPLRVIRGKKMSNGNSLMALEGQLDRYYLVPTYMFDKFNFDYLQFRERRFLDYPSESYTERIELSYSGKPDHKETGKPEDRPASFWLKHERPKKAEGGHEDKWHGEEGEIPFNLGNQLDNLVKQIQIDHFADEAELADLKTPELWEKQKEILTLKIKIKNGATVSLEIRRLMHPFKDKKLDLARSSVEDAIDLTADRHIADIMRQYHDIQAHFRNEKATREREAARKKEEESKKNSPPEKPE